MYALVDAPGHLLTFCGIPAGWQDGRQRWQFCDPGGVEFVAPPLLVPRRTQDSAASPRLLLTAARILYVLDAAADGAKHACTSSIVGTRL